MLGCMEILYEHLNLTVDRRQLLSAFGPQWTVADVVRSLTYYGYEVVPGPARAGDIIFQGRHPGLVRERNLVENIHRGRRTFMPLRRLRPEIVMRKLCRPQ